MEMLKIMDFKSSNNHIFVIIALIGLGVWLSTLLGDEIEDPEYYIRMRDE
jgi:hypothetical protein